jgi:hypothetical protein
MPNPGSLFSCRGQKTYAVSWRTENQIINSSFHKNSPDPPTTLDAFNAIPRRARIKNAGQQYENSQPFSIQGARPPFEQLMLLLDLPNVVCKCGGTMPTSGD